MGTRTDYASGVEAKMMYGIVILSERGEGSRRCGCEGSFEILPPVGRQNDGIFQKH
jgi:hypothetical protein